MPHPARPHLTPTGTHHHLLPEPHARAQRSIPPPAPRLLPQSTPQAQRNGHDARPARDEVRHLVAVDAIRTVERAVVDDVTVIVVHPPVVPIEDVPADDGREDDEPPVEAQAADAERVRDERGVDAEEGAVREARQHRDGGEPVRVVDVDGEDLREGEEDAGGGEAPEAGGAEAFDEEVGADAGEEAAEEGEEGE